MKQGSSPIVSVIIPCYNHSALIKDTVKSITQQTFTDWECIIVNDGSTDDSEQVVMSLAAEDPRIIYISQPNKGPSAARNHGLKKASGKYIQFIDADDIIADNKLELQVAQISSETDLALAYCDFNWCDQSGNNVEVSWPWRVTLDNENPLHDIALYWATQITIPPCCFLFDARFFTEHNIREDENIRANEDYDLLLCVFSLKPRVFFQNQKLASYRIMQGSVSHNKKRLRSTYFHILDNQSRVFADDKKMISILRQKRRYVKREYIQYAPPYELGWWIFRARALARKILSREYYQKLKRMLGRG